MQPAAFTSLHASVCDASDRAAGGAVQQEHRREAAEAASGLVSAGPSAASGEEAAPIVFLHGVGLGMVCRHMPLHPRTSRTDIAWVAGEEQWGDRHPSSLLRLQHRIHIICPAQPHKVTTACNVRC